MRDIDQFLFFYFDGVPIFISAFIDLFTLTYDGEMWFIVVLGLIIGVTFSNYVNKKWKPNLLVLILIIPSMLIFFSYHISSVHSLKNDYKQISNMVYKQKNHYFEQNLKERKRLKETTSFSKDLEARRIQEKSKKSLIVRLLTRQFLFTLSIVSFFSIAFFKSNRTIRKYIDKIEDKREKEKAHKKFNERIEKNKDQPTKVKVSTNKEVLEWIHKERVKKDPDYAREVEEEAQDIKDCVKRWCNDL